MKLWQKIFLFTLTLVIIVVNASSLALLSNNHRLAIEREQQNALARHNYLDLEIRNKVSYSKVVERKFALTEAESLQIAINVLEQQQGDAGMGVALYKDRLPISFANEADIGTAVDLLNEPDYSSVIEESGNKTLLYIVSTIELSDRPYQLVTTYDISSTYELFRKDFDQIRVIGIISALLVSGILLLLVRGLLNPLRNLSSTTGLIASGDLDKRATVKGHDEVAEVARSFNTMADSIESNVTALEGLAESRRVFISNLAHEMKTPLTSILGFADLLRVKREVSESERIEYASVIVSETKRLQELSGKLMELLFVGNLETSPVVVAVKDFAAELTTVLEPIVANHSLELRCELPGKPVFIRIDKEMMKSFIFNLVDNSIKASSPQHVIRLIFEEVSASAEEAGLVAAESDTALEANEGGPFEGSSAEGGPFEGDPAEVLELVKITVVDEGIGIPSEEIALIVEPFYMLDKARTRKHGGAGLGLALCSEIARAHGSKLIIKSIEGRGTAISVLLKKEKGA
ncbi:MAG: HAMP domain-containing histidine kinase [Coriobacteriales bacterium]|nr:HAMP domain-containing histidine kinase [Coriobacteriales bacterium]